jgi:tetratricopeptide (TPR) repeat protein
MLRRTALLLTLLAAVPAPARDQAENWLKVRSQHFTVVTNANEKTGRRIADQFERMRSVFLVALPRLSVDPGVPIVVLAIKGEKGFRALEPQGYLARGQLKLNGQFMRAPDKNYVLMRVDADGDHPYSVVYHEYTHLLLSKSAEWLPLWLNEGLAEFYQNTVIREKEVALGQPSRENLELLRTNGLLPLATLFTVDPSSPYYHEEDKGSIFYAESWALTHYIEVTDDRDKTHRMNDYAGLLAQKVDPVTAATRVFGDLKQLQSSLENYIRQDKFVYFPLSTTTAVDSAAFQVQPMTATQADAVLADFLAYNQRVADARPLLDRVLQEDPENVQAHETMGFLEFRAGHLEEARTWYAEAVKLDSQNYLAQYYFAVMSWDGLGPGGDAQVESSLRAAIKLNPSFAPAYDRLAAFEGIHHRNLDDAHRMALNAVQLDPGNVAYRMTVANVLVEMERPKDAVVVLQGALRLAKSPQETAMLDNFLTHAEEYATHREQEKERSLRLAEEWKASAEANAAAANVITAPPEEELPKGPHRFLVGKLQNVHCHTPSIDMTVAANGKTTALHSGNYSKIEFTALGFIRKQELDPCKDLEGWSAMVEYVLSSAKPAVAYVIGIELHK